MARRKIHIVYTFDGRWWTAEAPFLKGAYSQGRTRDSARRNLMGAIRDLLAAYADLGVSAPTIRKVDVELTDLVA
ncbi:MAG: type II toxin-antitoxin system HicB family antitoxin [Deltaproteobacteria bacterium]|nr:type II toxin-antitoxin system HicB family antitoxin [Deltaproteobacteria bacterium]